MIGVATVFGKATTGRAISTLSGYAAQKAAIGWIGRTVGGFAVKQGSGYVAALAGLALIPGPVLGAIVGSFVGNILYTSCQKIGSQQTQRIVQKYQEDVI